MVLTVVNTSWQIDQYEYIASLINKEIVYICTREDCISYLLKYFPGRAYYDYSDIYVLNENRISVYTRLKYYSIIWKKLNVINKHVSFFATDKRWNAIDLLASIKFGKAKIVLLVHGFVDTNHRLHARIIQLLIITLQAHRVFNINQDLNIPASMRQLKVSNYNHYKSIVLFSSGDGRYYRGKNHSKLIKIYETISILRPDYQIIIKYKSGEERVNIATAEIAPNFHSFTSLIKEYKPSLVAAHKSSNTCVQAILLGIDVISYDHELTNSARSDELSLFMNKLIQSQYAKKIDESTYLIKVHDEIIQLAKKSFVPNVHDSIMKAFSYS